MFAAFPPRGRGVVVWRLCDRLPAPRGAPGDEVGAGERDEPRQQRRGEDGGRLEGDEDGKREGGGVVGDEQRPGERANVQRVAAAVVRLAVEVAGVAQQRFGDGGRVLLLDFGAQGGGVVPGG